MFAGSGEDDDEAEDAGDMDYIARQDVRKVLMSVANGRVSLAMGRRADDVGVVR